MDRVKAKEWEKALTGTSIKGWKIESLIDHGKSAAVFVARKGSRKVALKLFDDELIERYGDSVQLARIDRELTLVGKSHRNMVKILDGGYDSSTKNHFIVMEYLDGPNLKKALSKVPEENIPQLIEQLASVGEFLEKLGLAHRDIKPENIILLEDYQRLVLLDFGVLKPVGEVSVTDANGIQSFVGTLQYSSPEFLLRLEEDKTEDWRALTFYQIGGILHDLIMRRPLFQQFINPYARLVNAVQYDTPQIKSSTVPAYLVEAAKSALAKDPHTRLLLLTWDSFKRPKSSVGTASAKERVTKRSLRVEAERSATAVNDVRGTELRETVINLLKLEVRNVRNSNTAGLPPLVSVARAQRGSDTLVVQFRASDQLELPKGLTVCLKVEVLDAAAQAISVSASAHRGHRPAPPDAEHFTRIFQGLFPAPGLSVALESCIYVAVDQVQQDVTAIVQDLDLAELKVG